MLRSADSGFESRRVRRGSNPEFDKKRRKEDVFVVEP
jgi:hypothetical protein